MLILSMFLFISNIVVANLTHHYIIIYVDSHLSLRLRNFFLHIYIVTCTFIFYFKIYENNSTPKGYLFLANYKKFKDNDGMDRKGSDVDVQNLIELFTDLGYNVDQYRYSNMTKEVSS